MNSGGRFGLRLASLSVTSFPCRLQSERSLNSLARRKHRRKLTTPLKGARDSDFIVGLDSVVPSILRQPCLPEFYQFCRAIKCASAVRAQKASSPIWRRPRSALRRGIYKCGVGQSNSDRAKRTSDVRIRFGHGYIPPKSEYNANICEYQKHRQGCADRSVRPKVSNSY